MEYKKQSISAGFTIVELLIVIVVIGILAAITLVAYNGVQNRARTASVSSGLNQVAKKIALQQVDTPGVYPADKTALLALGIEESGSLTYQYSVNNVTIPATYCVTATDGDVSYYLNNTTTLSPTSGGCAGHGVGGVGAVTNLLTNPSFESNDTGSPYRWFGSSPGAGVNERVAGIGINGGFGVRKTWTIVPTISQDTGFQWQYNSPTIGETYTCSAHATASVTQEMKARIEYYNSSDVRFANTNGASSSVPANTLTRLSATGATPASTVRLQCVIEVTAGASYINFAVGDRMWADAAMLTTGPTVYSYADGNSPNWIWNGAANNSNSTGPSL